MWKLKKLNEDETICLISEKRSYSIGRKDCDLVLEEDSSISRKHVTAYVAKKEDCSFPVDTLTGIWIVDEHSKYGTYLRNGKEWEKLNAREEKPLTHGNIIKFGLFENIWRVEYTPIVACTSGIQNEEKNKIESILKSIDGELKNTWSEDCTLVIVNEIILTVKVVLALINGVPIVRVDYVTKLVDSVRNRTPLPYCKDYRPVIQESVLNASLVSLDPNNTRKELFKGQIFVFPTKKQLETLKEVVLSAGGKTDLLPYCGNWDKLGGKNIVVIQLPTNKSNLPEKLIDKFQEIATFLKNKYGKRIVPESEIAQAVAYSSTEKYCNAMNECHEITLRPEKPDLGIVLVEETPEITEGFISEPFIVPCSSTVDPDDNDTFNINNFLLGRKRILSPDNCEPQSKISRNEENFIQLSNQRSKEECQIEFRSKLDSAEKDKCQDHFNNYSSKSKESKTKKSNVGEKNSSKCASITNYFKKQSKSSAEELQQSEPNPDKFDSSLSCDGNRSKRKLSSGVIPSEDDFNAKKFKLPIENRDKSIESNSTKSNLFLKPRDNVIKNSANSSRCLESDSPEGFIEKDRTKISFSQSGIHELNNTIYSLTLISSIYVNEDGSLIDPPEILVNVKKFKKQKICRVRNSLQLEKTDEEFFGSDWLEVHPLDSNNVSISEKNWW